MAFTTSSMIGADVNNSSSTALFALNTKVLGSGDSEWHYVVATQALVTGQFVYIQVNGTADVLATAMFVGLGVLGTTGQLDIGIAQTTFAAGAFGWVLKKGNNAQVLCSGTCPVGVPVGFTNSGTLVTGGLVAVSMTALGLFINVSASTGTQSVASALVTYPRPTGAGNGVISSL